MKKCILILGAVLSFNANAEIASGDDCGTNCYWAISDAGTLSVWSGNNENGQIGHYGFADNDTTTSAPWGEYKEQIKNIEIKEGITDLGFDAFVRLSSQNPIVLPQSITTIQEGSLGYILTSEVVIPDTVTSIGFEAFTWSSASQINIPPFVTQIGGNAFRGTRLTDIVIPDTVETIGDGAFSYPKALETLVVGENTSLGHIFNWSGNEEPDLSHFQMYCSENNISACENALKSVNVADSDISSILTTYTKDGNGFYQIDDKLYATADLMTHNAACDDAANCQAILDAASQGKPFEVGGKYYATLDLFANGAACTDKKNCEDILSSNGNPFKVGSKIYNSMADFAYGNYLKHRIYTVEEANFVAGPVNRVSIKYR